MNLPALPGSDEGTLSRNHFHPFYRVTPKRFWGKANMHSKKMDESQETCDHFFKRNGPNIECSKCHIGWLAPYDFTVKRGKLYYRSKLVL